KIPADGNIVEGRSDVDEALITGESRPVAKISGDEVIAGSINGDGSLKIKVSKIGESTFLAGVMRLVAEAEASKSRLQVLSDRAALYLTVIAISTGVLAFVVWFFSGAGAAFALERFVAVLVIACPHALGLAVPLVASISTTMAAQSGLLIKRRLALEAARKIDVVLFDKTGTLTRGEYGVDTVIPNIGISADEVLRLAASVNSRSEHPIAKALLNEAAKQKINILEILDFQRIPGKGAMAKIGSKEISVGSETLLGESGLEVQEEFKNKINILEKQGKTIIYVISENKLMGIIALADIIREESREAVEVLKKMGVRVAMITGDSEDVAAWVAKELGIDEYFAKVLPEQKSEKVKFLQGRGQKVAMVGDGVNDAPALTQSDVGIAIGAGTNVAIESAGIILVKNDPRDIPKIVRLSRLTYKKMLQNLFWATGYNVFALPLAAGVLAFKGVLLQPAVAAVLMSLSTIIVAVNAVLLKRAEKKL
ncbi:heavy metal translocating P-type ATPase, partial [Candidatus Falkowbacteria bacterium]|nr:heavy metal translocating P-type ATPase [Candidatus Falkowbacteria bacterium]